MSFSPAGGPAAPGGHLSDAAAGGRGVQGHVLHHAAHERIGPQERGREARVLDGTRNDCDQRVKAHRDEVLLAERHHRTALPTRPATQDLESVEF